MSIEVRVINSSPLNIPLKEGMTYEDVCIECCKVCEISPFTRHLFAVRKLDSLFFQCPSDIVNWNFVSGTQKLELKLRFWPTDISQNKLGKNTLNYFFEQVKSDYVEGKIIAFNSRTLESEALGLGVTAMYCYMIDHSVSMSEVIANYKKFLPKIVRKNCHLALSLESLRKSLKQIVGNPPGEVWFFKEKFLSQVAQIASEYVQESYPVRAKVGSNETDYSLVIDPVDKERPGIKLISTKRKIQNFFMCGINEICFISVRSDNTMEVSRINGIPQYLVFNSEESLKSCVCALNGYYHLMEKWMFDLCSEMVTPSLKKLWQNKIHGPVGKNFAYEKLRQKKSNAQGSYLVRESESTYDEYYLDVCLMGDDVPTTFCIKKNSEGYFFEGFDKSFKNVQELLVNHSEATNGILVLKDCVPPSENDVSDLLLCRHKLESIPKSDKTDSSSQLPVCIPPQVIQIFRGIEGEGILHGRYTMVNRGIWRNNEKKIEIARKVLKPEHQSTFSQEFLESVQKFIFWRCETIVVSYGIILGTSLNLIMEYLPLGPFDKYLKTHTFEVIDLIEASASLARALFYLEEKGHIHGNVRCRNLLVAAHEENSIRIKLSDPGISDFSENELPWIPVELYGHLGKAKLMYTSDIWSAGITLWEIFSLGKSPCDGNSGSKLAMSFLRGWRLPKPEKCPSEIYRIMLEMWSPDSHQRPKAQSVMRDINQILYEVFNSRRNHAYDEIQPRNQLNGSIYSESMATTLAAFSIESDIDCSQVRINQTSNWIKDTSLEVLFIGMGMSSSTSSDNESMDTTTELFELESNKLELGKIIGQGYYGEVQMGFITHNDGTCETVAVKKLKSSAFSSPESMDLLHECKIMQELKHPNIVEVKAVLNGERTMLVMEYIPMGSLLTYVKSEKERVTNKQLLKFASDIAEGMEYLGQKNIVHRDLAARNILVASEDLVKISDFGLARHVGFNGFYTVKRNAQNLPMPWYAPESLSYCTFSVQSDVWSYGVTLYEMFSRGVQPTLVSGDHTQLLRALQQNRRLPCPLECPLVIYRDLMFPCWNSEANKRPSFSSILRTIHSLETQLSLMN